VGAGGLGSPAALYLAAAGVGTIGLVDADKIELSNLQRQVLFTTGDLGHSKAESAAARLTALNPNIRVIAHNERLTAANAEKLIAGYDFVVDGSDNFATHYLINDACVLAKKPFVYGAVQGFAGEAGAVMPHKTACYRCLYPAPPPADEAPDCATAGVVGVMPGLIGMIEATEAIKLILGVGETLAGRALRCDALKMKFREVSVPRDENCAACGKNASIRRLDEKNYGGHDCAMTTDITADELKRELQGKPAPFLLDVRNQNEFDVGYIDGAVLIPLPVLADRLGELDRNADIVIYCAHGIRGGKAAKLLRENGFSRVRNLTGGIAAFDPRFD
jgi:adenylyltransferase/sulfurtransferase